ncbi:MAG: cation-translocating P-type ATPase [Tissierellia bacterium]|nr:cation-translocating P-type ATPase [Tissierellia bacterium]
MEWFNKKIPVVLEELNVQKDLGLNDEQVKERLEKYGSNQLEEQEKKPFIKKLAEQFLDPMIIILLIASIVSAIMKEWVDSIIIIAIVIVNAILSLTQEGKAEEAIAALKKMSSPKAKVRRNGNLTEVDSQNLVPGDIVILETGDIIPADLRLIESSNLKIDEASLTGESVPVEKDAKALYEGVMEIGDRENVAYSSTIVTYGRGVGVVTKTGKLTEIGKIAESISNLEDEETPLQRKLAGLSKSLGFLLVGVCILVFVVGLIYKMDTLSMFMTSISLAVAAIPEGLPAIVTIVLSIGMGRMAKKNAIVKKLLAVETLGTTTVICSDKTGTLTQNEMTVTKVYVNDQTLDVTGTGYEPNGSFTMDSKEIGPEDIPGFHYLGMIGALTNDSELVEEEGHLTMHGDPTEGALVTMAGKAGLNQKILEKDYPRVEEIPFDSERKMMTTFHKNFIDSPIVSFTKGAPDIILERCNKIYLGGEKQDLTEELRQKILDKNSEFARQALRVLAFAFREYSEIPGTITSDTIEKDMVFVGLTGMIDPARPEVKEAIKECRSAGIVPMMITGDYLETAVAIAKDLGIAQSEEEAIIGRELNEKTPEELQEIVKKKRVYARVSPENKVQIVSALKTNGQIAAMTGDGVNDAPAIKRADIGLAMGITGTDVAKNTAEVILTDDNFATIVHAVEEGRIIYSNIKKFVGFLLSCNLGEVLIVLLAIMLKLPVPLLPIQLLWLNLVTDSFPALALGVEQGEADIMYEPPRSPDEPILDKEIKVTIGIQSIAITVATLGAFIIGLQRFGDTGEGLMAARTMAFATLILSELLRSYSARSINFTLFQIGIFSNKTLVKATTLSFLLMVAVMYIPFLEKLFHLKDLGFNEWVIIIVASFIPFILGEIQKKIRFKKLHQEFK